MNNKSMIEKSMPSKGDGAAEVEKNLKNFFNERTDN